MGARSYQERTVAAVRRRWNAGARSVLMVAPTGSGKTRMAAACLGQGRALWVAHRRELVHQARAAVAREIGAENVGVIMAGEDESPTASVQVGTIETILTRGAPDQIDHLVLDEAHHYMAESYRTLVDLYRRVRSLRVLGMTATPQRYDGQPLGDIFEQLVVAAQYSELIEQGYIVPVQVVRPTEHLGNDLVMDPIEAWEKYAGGQSTFAFFGRVADAKDAVERWRVRGVRSETIDAHTGKVWRDDAITLFAMGRIDVLANVYALTEGVDVPDARVALSCRSFQFAGAMIQAYGRVLRAANGKRVATILDLTGATHTHGLPTEDRDYSLEGRAITASPAKQHPNENGYVYSQEIVGGALEVATMGVDAPDPALRALPIATEKSRGRVRLDKVKAIGRKHGRRQAEAALDYYDKLGE